MTYAEQLRKIVQAYLDAHDTDLCETHKIAAWAIQRGLWEESPVAMINRCADAISRSLRDEMIGSVRTKHAIRIIRDGTQMTLWADMRTAPREHMLLAFQQRRQQIIADCRQLKNDLGYYNEHYTPDEPIQISFNFEDDDAHGPVRSRSRGHN